MCLKNKNDVVKDGNGFRETGAHQLKTRLASFRSQVESFCKWHDNGTELCKNDQVSSFLTTVCYTSLHCWSPLWNKRPVLQKVTVYGKHLKSRQSHFRSSWRKTSTGKGTRFSFFSITCLYQVTPPPPPYVYVSALQICCLHADAQSIRRGHFFYENQSEQPGLELGSNHGNLYTRIPP